MISGSEITVFDSPLGCRIGILTCYDNNITENARLAALQGAEPMAVEEATTEMAEDDSPYIGGYLVVSGDNLWSISGQDTIYGDPYMWPLIYKANSGQIKDADLIHPGQYFYIPKAKGADRGAAIAHAKNRGAWTLGETEASDLDYLSQ